MNAVHPSSIFRGDIIIEGNMAQKPYQRFVL